MATPPKSKPNCTQCSHVVVCQHAIQVVTFTEVRVKGPIFTYDLPKRMLESLAGSCRCFDPDGNT